jgi:hypothetical protein
MTELGDLIRDAKELSKTLKADGRDLSMKDIPDYLHRIEKSELEIKNLKIDFETLKLFVLQKVK